MTLLWPTSLRPAQIMVNPVAFTRSGGRSLGGIERVTRTDRGWWEIAYKGIPLTSAARRQLWTSTRASLNGMATSIAVPALSFDVNGAESGIVVRTAAAASLGDTSIVLELVSGITNLAGVRFSYNHALYETGVVTSVAGAEWTLPIFPALRADIADATALEFNAPTCLVRLASDREMDISFSVGNVDKVDVAFVEDTEYWNTLADTAAPTNLVAPSITGAQVRVGYTLTAVEGEWTGHPTSYTYQWQHDVSGNGTFSNVAVGGTSQTYVPVVGDIADSLRVQVTAINGTGSSSAANSLGTIPIIAA